jgi:hypothetical protein
VNPIEHGLGPSSRITGVRIRKTPRTPNCRLRLGCHDAYNETQRQHREQRK